MKEHFNKLTPAEHERLSVLLGKCSEVIHVIGKILQHGYESDNNGKELHNNRLLLEKECGHVKNAVIMLYSADDLNKISINYYANENAIGIKQYLHHQEDT